MFSSTQPHTIVKLLSRLHFFFYHIFHKLAARLYSCPDILPCLAHFNGFALALSLSLSLSLVSHVIVILLTQKHDSGLFRVDIHLQGHLYNCSESFSIWSFECGALWGLVAALMKALIKVGLSRCSLSPTNREGQHL